MLQTPHPRGLHPSQEGGCGEPGGRPAVPGTEGELWDPLWSTAAREEGGKPAAHGGPAASVWRLEVKESVSQRPSCSQGNKEKTEGGRWPLCRSTRNEREESCGR